MQFLMAKSMKSQLLLLIIPFLLVMLPYFANIFELKNMFNKITQAFPIFFSYVSICSPHFPHWIPARSQSRPGCWGAPCRRVPDGTVEPMDKQWRRSARRRSSLVWAVVGSEWPPGHLWIKLDITGEKVGEFWRFFERRTANSVQELAKIGIFWGFSDWMDCMGRTGCFLHRTIWLYSTEKHISKEINVDDSKRGLYMGL